MRLQKSHQSGAGGRFASAIRMFAMGSGGPLHVDI